MMVLMVQGDTVTGPTGLGPYIVVRLVILPSDQSRPYKVTEPRSLCRWRSDTSELLGTVVFVPMSHVRDSGSCN